MEIVDRNGHHDSPNTVELGAAVNTNCSVGDALLVEGASPAGYNGYYPAGATNGIRAVGGTTISPWMRASELARPFSSPMKPSLFQTRRGPARCHQSTSRYRIIFY